MVLLRMGSMVGRLAEGQSVTVVTALSPFVVFGWSRIAAMALLWFNPPVYVRTDRPGLRFRVSHVEGVAA